MAVEGLTASRSLFNPRETVERIEAAVRAHGMMVFAHIDHAKAAEAAGLPLRPTDLLIFGNARGGTPLMQLDQTMGIDLPLRALVWQDSSGATWVGYDEPAWLAKRHGLGNTADAIVARLTAALETVVKEVTEAPPKP